MKLDTLKYILVTCIALTFLIKVSHVVSYLSYSGDNTEVLSMHDDASEKEEKKLETEYAIPQFVSNIQSYFPMVTAKKLIVPDYSFRLAYFPEVLTPPPSI